MLLFTVSVLVNFDFRDTQGFKVTMRSAQLPFADFSGAELLGAIFSSAEETVSRLRRQNTDLRGAAFRNARLNNANFVGTDLEYADFTNAVLIGADFTNTNINHAIFEGAAIESIDDDDENPEVTASDSLKVFQSFMMPKQAKQWTYTIRDLGANHTYLGGAGDTTRYVFLTLQR